MLNFYTVCPELCTNKICKYLLALKLPAEQ